MLQNKLKTDGGQCISRGKETYDEIKKDKDLLYTPKKNVGRWMKQTRWSLAEWYKDKNLNKVKMIKIKLYVGVTPQTNQLKTWIKY